MLHPYKIIALLLLLMSCHPKTQLVEKGDTRRSLPESYGKAGLLMEPTPIRPSSGEVDVIAFGSCNKHDKEQPLWDDVMRQHPDLWVWLGDAVYGDSEKEEVLRGKYDAQDRLEAYAKLKASTPVIGVWDDHDYGDNNGTKHFKGKLAAKAAFMDFVDVPEGHPSRQREGIYQAYVLGQPPRQVKVILLDTRTFRDEVAMDDKKAYVPDPNADILGESQWQWLEREVKENDAALTIIGNGSQVIANQHRFEKWANYPESRKRLFKLLAKNCPSGALLISGDRHHAELSKTRLRGMAHPLYDFTSSGLTHTRRYPQPEANRYREGNKVDQLNFGIIRIHWEENPVRVSLEIRGDDDALYESADFTLAS